MAHAAIVQTPTLAKPATLAAKIEMNPSTSRPLGRDAHRGGGRSLFLRFEGVNVETDVNSCEQTFGGTLVLDCGKGLIVPFVAGA